MDDLVSRVREAQCPEIDAAVEEVARTLIEIPSPTGEEHDIACYLEGLLEGAGLDVVRQEVESGRFNVIAETGEGVSSRSLMLNAHMDTSTNGRESRSLPIGLVPKATLEDGWLYGLGISNMKAAFASYYGALRMLERAGISIRGRLMVSGVVGEIEKAPIGRYQGPEYRGGGCGAAYGVQHGMMADIVIIGEPTGMRIQNGAAGYAFCRVSSSGRAQHTWSREHGENALAKSVKLMKRLEDWEPEYQAAAGGADIGARLTVGALEGGYPFKPSIAPAPSSDLYLDLRFAPEHSAIEIRRLLFERIRSWGAEDPDLAATLEFYLVRNGFFLAETEEAFELAVTAHEAAGGGETGAVVPARYFVSADASTFSEYGMKCLVYGPGGITRDGRYRMYDERGETVSMENIMTCARSYAVIIARYLGG